MVLIATLSTVLVLLIYILHVQLDPLILNPFSSNTSFEAPNLVYLLKSIYLFQLSPTKHCYL